MSRTSSTELLPVSVLKEIDQRLIGNGFGDYKAIAAELRERGHRKITKSGLHRHGQELKRRVQLARAQEQLAAAGVSAELAAELTGTATLVVVIDRRNGRARLMNLPATAPDVIRHLKQMKKA